MFTEVLDLREYPVRFGWKLVGLYNDLTQSSRGLAKYPDSIPTAIRSFEAMPESIHGLEFARLWEVFRYLRRGKQLVIPDAWKHLVPKPDSAGCHSASIK